MTPKERAIQEASTIIHQPSSLRSTQQLTRVIQEAEVQLLEQINAEAEADMLKGNPVTGAHHRAIEWRLKLLRQETP